MECTRTTGKAVATRQEVRTDERSEPFEIKAIAPARKMFMENNKRLSHLAAATGSGPLKPNNTSNAGYKGGYCTTGAKAPDSVGRLNPLPFARLLAAPI